MTSTTAAIEVEVDPMTAFTAFTDEWDQWWGNGPIDAYETWRLVERRMEPGVGGRLVEDYGDDQTVIGTITVWEPGERIAWQRGEVTIDVTFAPVAAGTLVTVTGTVPAGVDGTEDYSMVRMLPQWFPRHFARSVPRPDPGRLHLVLRSATPAATGRWLADVFQLECTGDVPAEEGDPEHTWIEFRVGNGLLVLWGAPASPGGDSPLVYVDDLDAHLAHATAAGAPIVSPIVEHGFRTYTAADCEGRHWLFAQSGPRVGR